MELTILLINTKMAHEAQVHSVSTEVELANVHASRSYLDPHRWKKERVVDCGVVKLNRVPKRCFNEACTLSIPAHQAVREFSAPHWVASCADGIPDGLAR